MPILRFENSSLAAREAATAPSPPLPLAHSRLLLELNRQD